MNFHLHKLIPIKYYRYKSIISDVLFSIHFNTVGINDSFNLDKLDYDKQSIYSSFKSFIEKIKYSNPDQHIETNKIVIECMTGDNNIINVGWYDGTLMFGFGRKGDSWVEPINIKYG
jgi:hypothetical protein